MSAPLATLASQSLRQIPHACGFASSQHTAAVFRQLVGATPSRYLQERRS